MATPQSTIQIRIDAKTKRESKRILELMGLDMSSAVKIMLRNVILTRSFPFELRTENGFTVAQERAMIADTEEALKHGKRFATVKEFMDGLEK